MSGRAANDLGVGPSFDGSITKTPMVANVFLSWSCHCLVIVERALRWDTGYDILLRRGRRQGLRERSCWSEIGQGQHARRAMERCLNGSYTKGGNTTSDVVLETMLMIYRFDKIKITAFPLPSLDGCLVAHGRNMKTQKSRSYIPYTIGILIAVFVIYRIQQFVSRPDALEKTLEFLSGIALCFGAVVLFIAVALIAPSLASRIKKKPHLKATDLHYEVDAVRTRPAVDSLKAYSLLGGGVFYNVVDARVRLYGSRPAH